ncbi:MAG: response regulator [Candidatus Peribacteraceae bacterium]|nr:response regulator [Candidatus Peribacteraceae bacterium]
METAKRAIVVDDDPQVLELLSLFIGRTLGDNFPLGKYNDASAALKDFKVDPNVAIAVLDFKMPKMSGVQLLSLMRVEARSHFPAVLVTGTSAEASEELAAKGVQIDALLDKPVRFEDFRKVVGKLLGGNGDRTAGC